MQDSHEIVGGFPAEDNALQLTRKGLHPHCALVGASHHQASVLIAFILSCVLAY